MIQDATVEIESDADFGPVPPMLDPDNIIIVGQGSTLGGSTNLHFTNSMEVNANRGIRVDSWLGDISVDAGHRVTYSGNITGDGSFAKQGAGTLELNGPVQNHSTIWVNGGTLGGTFDYSGLNASIEVKDGATIAPGLIRVDPTNASGTTSFHVPIFTMHDHSSFDVFIKEGNYQGTNYLYSNRIIGNTYGSFKIGVWITFNIYADGLSGTLTDPESFQLMGAYGMEFPLIEGDGTTGLGPVEFKLPTGTDTIVTRNGGLTFNMVGFNAGDRFVLRRGGDGWEPRVYLDYFPAETHSPILDLHPHLLDFASVVGDTAASQTATLANTGDAVLNIHDITVTGGFTYEMGSSTCGATLAIGASCTLDVSFTPADTITYNGQIQITSDADSSLDIVTLHGVGNVPDIHAPAIDLSADSLDFGSVQLGETTASKTVTLTNTGDSAVHISDIIITGGFTYDAGNSTCRSALAIGASCTISVFFKPVTAGAFSGQMQISSDADSSPDLVTLSGSGIIPPMAPKKIPSISLWGLCILVGLLVLIGVRQQKALPRNL